MPEMTTLSEMQEEKRRSKWIRQIAQSFERYPDRLDKQRARLLLISNFMIFCGALIALAFSLNGSSSLAVNGTIYLVFSILSLLLISTGRLRAVSLITVLAIASLLMSEGISEGQIRSLPVLLIFTTLIAGYLLGLKTIFISCGANIILLAIAAYLSGRVAATEILSITLRGALIQGASGILIWAFLRNVYTWIQQIEKNSLNMSTAVRLAENMSHATDLNDLLQAAIDMITEAFDLQYGQAFTVDADLTFARIEAGTGEIGENMLSMGHAILVGSETLVGQSAQQGERIICNDVSENPLFIPVEALEGTQSEIAIPLKVGDRVIGVLDLFSREKNRFTEDTLSILEVVSAQLAISADKFDLVRELQIRINENESLLIETQKNLSQIEDMASFMTLESWKQYLNLRSREKTIGFTLNDNYIKTDSLDSHIIEEISNSNRVVLFNEESGHTVAGFPLRVRGKTIGALTVEKDSGEPWTDNEKDLLEDLGGRLATVIDNTRLYEQASLLAKKERVINKVSQDIQKSESLDQILQASLTELSQILGAAKGIIRLHAKGDEAGNVASLIQNKEGEA